MNSLIKESIIKFIFVFLVLFIVGHFIKSINLNIVKSLVIAATITCIEFVRDRIKKSKK